MPYMLEDQTGKDLMQKWPYMPPCKGVIDSFNTQHLLSICIQQCYKVWYMGDIHRFDNEYELWGVSNNWGQRAKNVIPNYEFH